MARLMTTLSDNGYKNWVKGGLALKFSREGIENFVERNIDTFHQDVMNSLSSGANCSLCSTENIIQCTSRYNNNFCKFKKNSCKVHDSKDPTKTSRPCPNSVCNLVRDKIHNKHRFCGPTWRNSNSKRWCLEPWQLATCYMPPTGKTKLNTASETDITGLLNVVINNKVFDTEVTDDMTKDDNIFCQARDARNEILHKADMKLTNRQLTDYITTLDNMLSDRKHLASHPDAIRGRQLLQQLLNGTLNVTERDEVEVLAEALRAIDDKTYKAIAAVKKEKDNARDVLKTDKDEALIAVNKEKDNARDVLKTDKDEALTAVNKEKDNARDVLKTDKDEALTAVNKEKDNARDVLKTDKEEALTAVNKEKDNARDVLKTDKDEALTAVNKEKDNARDVLKTDKDEALTAVNKEKDNARDVLKTDKDEALTAVNKEKDNARDVLKTDKDEALTAVNKEKDNARDVLKTDKDEALTAVNKEKDNARDVLKTDKDEALTAVNKEKDNARDVLKTNKDEALTAVNKEKDNATNRIKKEEQETIAALQDALIEALRIIKEKQEEAAANLQTLSHDTYTKIKKDLKTELLSIYQDNEHLYTPLSPQDPLEDKHIEQLYVTPNMKLVDHRRVQKDEGTPIKTYKDILKEGKKKIYIVGETGTGKTAFCQEMVSNWCKVQTIETEHPENMSDNQLAMANYDFLFYISLRDETIHSNVEEMIKHSLLPNKPSLHEPLSKVLKEERCLVVLDGLDEWTTENKTASSSHVNKGLPGRDSVRNCTVITTTRPWKLEVLQLKSSQIDAKVEILGIDEISCEQLAQNMITHLNDRYHIHKTYEDFNVEIKENKLNKLILIPLILKQIVCLWHWGKEIGKTKTDIYIQMFVLLLELAQSGLEKDAQYQHKKEEWMKSSIKLPPCLDDNETCQEFKPLIVALTKLAFQTLLSDGQESALVFKSTKAGCYHLSQEEVNICLKIGILCQSKILKCVVLPFKKISFLHTTFQEFLAALFVSLEQSDTKHGTETMQTFCNTDIKCCKMSNILTFISGTCTSDITCTLVQHFYNTIRHYVQIDNNTDNLISLSSIIVDCMREGWTCDHDNKHLCCDYIAIDEPSEYLDQLCKVNIPNITQLSIHSTPTVPCLQYLQQIRTLELLRFTSYSHPPRPSEDLLYDLIHHHKDTLTVIDIGVMTLRSSTRLSSLIRQISNLRLLSLYYITLPLQLRYSLQALHSPPDRHVVITEPTILPNTESTD